MSSPGNRAIDMMADAVDSLQPPSSVAVALADKAAARARRELERAQDWQCFIRQESARVFGAAAAARIASHDSHDFAYLARESVQAAAALWDALPEDCKL